MKKSVYVGVVEWVCKLCGVTYTTVASPEYVVESEEARAEA